MSRILIVSLMGVCLLWSAGSAQEQAGQVPSIAEQAPNTWVKRSPLPDGPPSPRLGYESSWGYDQPAGKMIRWGGHDPGGGGPQLTETWTYDIATGRWDYMQTNNNPPGNCCCRENAVCPLDNKFYRFSYPAFGHGWFWDRSRYLREDSVWTYDLASNTWTNMRPGKEPALNVGKPVVWDPSRQVFWVYDTKLRLYDPYTNTWHTANDGTKVAGGGKGVGKRTYAGMALDPERNKIVLFGDHYQSDPRTLVYDIAKDEWIDMKPAASPPWDRSCPSMVYDSANRIMLCVTLGGRWDTKEASERHLETWTYNLGANTWTKMDVAVMPEHFGTRDRLMEYLPDRNIVILESRGQDQQIWTYRYKVPPPPAPRPPTPTDLKVEVMEDGRATLSWQGFPSTRSFLFRVYRAQADLPWRTGFKQVTDKPVTGTTFADSGLQAGKVYCYYVTAVAGQAEGLPSARIRTQPRLIVDSRVDVQAADKVVYSWRKSADPDVAGYVVERAVLAPISGAQKLSYANQYKDKLPLEAMVEKRGLSEWVRLTPKPIAETSLTDTVDLSKPVKVEQYSWQPYFGALPESGQNKAYDMSKPGCPLTIYAYRVRAVNRLGVEGGPSPYQMTVPNEVQNLMSREADDRKSASIKWDASPHQGLRGYLVYRLNGRGFQWDKDSFVELLTPEPIRATTFTDATRPGKTCRYYVVVVDAVGQQGLASHGAWAFRNPYGSHYARWYPKDGWHQ